MQTKREVRHKSAWPPFSLPVPEQGVCCLLFGQTRGSAPRVGCIVFGSQETLDRILVDLWSIAFGF